MMVFPADLPAPLVVGNAVAVDDRAGRTPMAGGNTRSRPVTGVVPMAHDVSWTLTAAERVELHDFVAQVRTARFQIPLAIPGGGLRSVVARFLAPPSAPMGWAALGNTVSQITARLLVDDAAIIGDSDVLVASDGSGDPLTDSDGGGDPLIWQELS